MNFSVNRTPRILAKNKLSVSLSPYIENRFTNEVNQRPTINTEGAQALIANLAHRLANGKYCTTSETLDLAPLVLAAGLVVTLSLHDQLDDQIDLILLLNTKPQHLGQVNVYVDKSGQVNYTWELNLT